MQKEKVTIVSFDSSTTKTGYAVFTSGRLVKSGVITKKDKSMENRVNEMCLETREIIKTHKPAVVIAEKPPFVHNADGLIMLSEIVGSIRGYCVSEGIQYTEYSPPVWRKFISPNESIPRKRVECKIWDIKKASDIFGITPEDDNEADAILIGQAYINEFSEQKKTG